MTPFDLTVVAVAISEVRKRNSKSTPLDFLEVVATVLVASDCEPSDIADNFETVAARLRKGPPPW